MRVAEDLILQKTADFVGREYVFDAVDEFMRDNDRGFLVLEGDPGAGKTSILAEYVRRTRCIGHFNLRAQGLNTTQHFVGSLSRQMTERYGTYSAVNAGGGEGSGEPVTQILLELRAHLPEELPLVIAVDALDEAMVDSAATNPLFLPQILGKGIYFVLTTRRQEAALRFDGPFQRMDLKDFHAETMADVRRYLENSLSRDAIARRVDNSHLSRTEFVMRLSDMSEGNFMYLYYTLNDIALSPRLDLDRFMRELPRGLEGYYRHHWDLMGMKADDRAPTVNAWILYILCEAGTPLPAWIISSVLRPVTTEASAAFVQNRLNQWRQFLHADNSTSPAEYSLYHASFRDFLHRKDVVANARMDLRNVNQVIADLLKEHELGEDGDLWLGI